MNQRENLLSLLRRQSFEYIPVEFSLCPSLIEEFKKQTKSNLSYIEYFQMPWRFVDDIKLDVHDTEKFNKYYNYDLKAGTNIDHWGIAYEPGSETAKHMTHMRHPLTNVEDIEDMISYPFPDYLNAISSHQKQQVNDIQTKGFAAVGNMQCTIWETSWYIRSMEELMMDMMTYDPKASYLLDKITEYALIRASAFAKAGVDILFLGDDIGMQNSVMMSEEMYAYWLKPRLKKVIQEVKKIKPDIIVFYHSCGFVVPFIPHLIDAGVDVLNPIQSECMNFKEIHAQFGDRLSFHGTIGTQTTMPFGTPDEVRSEVFKNLEIAGNKGGLFIAPTHVLEPEVPWDNVIAYVKACHDFTR